MDGKDSLKQLLFKSHLNHAQIGKTTELNLCTIDKRKKNGGGCEKMLPVRIIKTQMIIKAPGKIGDILSTFAIMVPVEVELLYDIIWRKRKMSPQVIQS